MPLPVLPVVCPSSSGVVNVQLDVSVATVNTGAFQLRTRAYTGSHAPLGPTIVVHPGDLLNIHLTNSLGGGLGLANVTNVHLHGLHVSPAGNADNVHIAVGPGNSTTFSYVIPQDHARGTFWYHPHYHKSTALQLASGLAGALIVADPETTAYRDIVLLLQTWVLSTGSRLTGQLPDLAAYTGDALPSQITDALGVGQYVTANGRYRPSVAISQNEWVRLRLINAGGASYLQPDFTAPALVTLGCTATLIALDGVTLTTARPLTASLFIPPGGRADVLLRCTVTGSAGLPNDPVVPSGSGILDGPLVTGDILTFVATPGVNPAGPAPVFTAPAWADLRTSAVGNSWDMEFDGSQMTVNGFPFMHDQPQMTTSLGVVQEWHLAVGVDSANHPYHHHVNHFQITEVTGNLAASGLVVGDWRDTIPLANEAAGSVTVRFVPQDYTGLMMLHCHVAYHSDEGMAAEVNITGTEQTVARGPVTYSSFCPSVTASTVPGGNSDSDSVSAASLLLASLLWVAQ
jgi:FtsP/CotA-like multicopper oxidase with cupredoxin domain